MKIGAVATDDAEVSVHIFRSSSYAEGVRKEHSNLMVDINMNGDAYSFPLKPPSARALAALLVSAIESLKNKDDRE